MKKSFFSNTKITILGLLAIVIIGFSSCFPGYYDGYGYQSGYYDGGIGIGYSGYYRPFPRFRIFNHYHGSPYYNNHYYAPRNRIRR